MTRLRDVAEATPPPISCRAQGGQVDVMLLKAFSCFINGLWHERHLKIAPVAVWELLVAGASQALLFGRVRRVSRAVIERKMRLKRFELLGPGVLWRKSPQNSDLSETLRRLNI